MFGQDRGDLNHMVHIGFGSRALPHLPGMGAGGEKRGAQDLRGKIGLHGEFTSAPGQNRKGDAGRPKA